MNQQASKRETDSPAGEVFPAAGAEIAFYMRELDLIEAQRIAKLGTFRWCFTTGVTTWSRELYRIFERDVALPALTFDEHLAYYSHEDADRLKEAMRQVIATGASFALDLEITLPSGQHKWVSGRCEADVLPSGEVIQVRGTIQDISERKQAEEALREQAELLELAHDTIMVCDLDGTIRNWNHGAERMYGYNKQQAIGKNAHALLKTLAPPSTAWIKATLLEEGSWEGELTHTAQNGAQIVVASRWVLQRGKNGRPCGMMEINNDITARKRTEQALRASESRFRKLFESDLMGIAVPDRFGGFHEGNDEFLRIVGYSRADLEAGLVRWDVMTPPEYADLDALHIAEAAERGSCTPYEKEYICKDGHRTPILCGYALLEGSKDQYVGFVQDLTPQKQAEAELREREERFRVLAESLPQMVWIHDASGQYVYGNQRLRDYLGGAREWLNMQTWDFVHPDDREGTVRKWQNSVEAGESFENEYRLLRHDGVDRYFLARAVPIRGVSGTVERWLVSSTDIHDQKLAEEALRRSEKLATAGRLAASMAHEINNPLASVVNTVYLALRDPSLSDATRELLNTADRELTRVAQFTAQTLRFHKQSNAATSADLGEIMESVLAMYAPRLRSSRVQVERVYLAAGKLLCFESEMRQVFANLVSNALDALGQNGLMRVRIKSSRRWDGSGAGGIRVTISDNGAGIPPSVRSRVFEPFVSTKETTGVGLGLWVTQGIVQKHGGRIGLRTSTDPQRHGTVFSLFFPLPPTAA